MALEPSPVFAYDARGNRASMTVSGKERYTVSYAYDANNRLLTERKTRGLLTDLTTYAYDANGNHLSKTFNGGDGSLTGATYTYNLFNQLSTAAENGLTAAYAYNAQGIRTCKATATSQTDFLLDGGNVVGEHIGSKTVTYLRGANLISRSDGSKKTYYLFNAHGDVTELVSDSSTVTHKYDYDAFGVEKKPDPLDGNPFRYCGEYYDGETKTYYLRARYYDPNIGRFTSEDTYRGEPNDPLTLNLYTYCVNNPVRYSDSTGNAIEDATRWLVRKILAFSSFVQATQDGEYSNLFYLGGFVRDTSGIYHARQDAIQQIFGYDDFYDTVFYYATDMESDNFKFTYGNRDYIFWAWKGDYLNLGAGAELGIYSNQSGVGGHGSITCPFSDHWLVDTNLAMKMTLTLNDTNGNQLFSYNPSEKQWWITGFNPYYQDVNASDLIATYTITFDDIEMFMAFYRAWYGVDDRWSFDFDTYTAKLVF